MVTHARIMKYYLRYPGTVLCFTMVDFDTCRHMQYSKTCAVLKLIFPLLVSSTEAAAPYFHGGGGGGAQR